MQADEQVTISDGHVSLTRRAAWLLFAKTVAYGLSFALPLLLVRRLSQHEFGLYKQVFLLVGTAVTVLPLGFGMSAFYFFPRERERRGQIAFNILIFYSLAGGLACLILLLRPSLVATILNSPELATYAPIMALAIFFWAVSSFFEMVAVANQEPKTATIFIIGAQFTKGLLLLNAAIWFETVESLIYAAIAQGILQTTAMLWYLHSRFPRFWGGFDWTILRYQLSYALPLGFAGLLYAMQMDLHNYFVSNQFGPTNYAIYAIGCFQLPLVAILGESVSSVMIPRISFLQKHGKQGEIVQLTATVMRTLSAIYFPLYAFLIVMGPIVISVLFTDRYSASWPIFAVNLTLLPFSVLVLDPVQRAYAGERYFLLKLHLVLFITLVAILWIGTKSLGLIGVVTVVVALSVLDRVIKAFRFGRIVGVSRHDLNLLKDVGKTAVAATVAGVVTAITRLYVNDFGSGASLIACGVVFSVVYLMAMWLLGFLTIDERRAIQKLIFRTQTAGAGDGV